MSQFDGIQKTAFSAVKNLFGDSLVWVPSNGGQMQIENVLYSSPEIDVTLGDTDKYQYSPYKYSFEYFENQLIGLKLSVDEGNIETVAIKGKILCVRDCKATSDGKTIIAFCDDYKI